ncbi:alpha/beta hydrolase family protein [Dictyobacter arantiisoli]|uniref:Peptidase S9 prolyl oligopeptidase catalytic domain-containing protein n=1 Tax=Dictyobacter arantiisoli TaxID=2014874 RepID=A0A5A5TIZ5_9CHLR|nr:prolyl oligopeptidase family serine peptidase [Dictyobacter arantiisoli]GCF11581.1 hypothetical protein KDI_51450 [Dictyobacter arantiisoli]
MLDPKFFDYPATTSSEVHVISQQHHKHATIQDITYPSPAGGQVPAYLIVPDRQGPFAGMIFVHWGQLDRHEFVDEAMILAELGVVSLCIDAPTRRPRALQANIPAETAARDLGLQIVADVRHGIDILAARPDIDLQRLGYVGHSYGATNGGIIAGVEKRFKTYVLMAGYASMSDAYRVSNHPFLSKWRHRTSWEEQERYLHLIEPLDAVHYIGYATPASAFFQFSHQDEFVSEEQALRYFEAANHPKQMRWYDSSHELNAQARMDRARWLCQELKLGSLPARIETKLSE